MKAFKSNKHFHLEVIIPRDQTYFWNERLSIELRNTKVIIPRDPEKAF